MTCNLCTVNELVNEVRAAGGQIYISPPDEYGIDVFVIPRGQKQDFSLRHDGTCSPQRQLWVNMIPESCECEQEIPRNFPVDYVPGRNRTVAAPPAEQAEPLSLL